MRKSAMRVLACSLAMMVAFSTLAPVKTARAEKEVLAAAAKAASLGIFRNRGDDSLLASEGKTLYLTADMADEGQITISGGTYERIVVPKEIGEIKITFDQSEVGELIVESGSTASILLRTTTAAKVTIEEPKLKEIDWTELRHLLTDEQTIQKVIEDYTRLQEENERYRNSAPRIMAAQGAVISSLTAGAGVSLDLKHGEVGSLSVKTGVKLTRTEIAVEGYHGDIAYTGGDSFGIVSLKLKNSEVGRLTVSETCGSNYLLVSGNNSFADNIEVAGNANVSLNIPADALTVTADAEDARVDVLNKVDNMSVAADNARIEIAPIGSVASAEVSGNKVSIGGGGMLGKADLTGEDAYVSTKGTEIEGENTYIPPVYTAPSVTVTPKPTPTEIPVTPPASGDRVTLTGNTVEVSRAEVGDTVRFGSYEQDNDFDNGAEAIEWFVLDKQDGKLLLFSKNALDVKPYHEKREAVTWETCTLRSWLNGEFFHTAFSGTEQGRILTAKGKNEDNPKYGTGGGNDTEDKVFLLSLEEALRYFDPDLGAKDPVRCAKVTEYVKAKGGYYEKNGEHAGNGWWWLRSPGYDSTNVAFVINTGCVDVWGDHVDFEDVVRPAFWLNLESETPTPTPASTSERLTFKFADMKYGGYGYILKEAADGGVHVAFEGQYQEIRFTLPQEIDLAQYDKVVFSMMTATAEDAVALKVVASDAELDLYNNPIPLHTRWGVTTSGVQNVELSLAEYAGKKLNRIGIMANNGAANITLYSVTFVPKEGAGGNIPTPTPGVTGIPTPTPIYLNPPPETPNGLTYKFADMGEPNGYGYKYSAGPYNGVHVAFEGQYQEIRFTLPQEIDLRQYDKVVFSMMTVTTEDTVALKIIASDAELDQYNNPTPMEIKWNVTTLGAENVEVSLAAHADKKVGEIAIMATDGAAYIMLYSVTFVPKEGAGGNIPTPPPTSTSEGLTFRFADIEDSGYGYTLGEAADGGVNVAFSAQYQEVRYTLPQEIDLSQYDKVGFSMMAATAEDAVALKVVASDAELDEWSNSIPLCTYWGITTSGVQNIELSLAKYAGKKLNRIGIMAQEGAANITLYSITFVPKEGSGENIPTPTPGVTGIPTLTPTPTPSGSGTVFIPSATGDRVTLTGETAEVSKAQVGDTVWYGSYEQDNDFGNGAEAIEWLVLDKQDGKLLLLSKDALDCKKYNEKLEVVTWETCTLRGWLNGEFYNIAFSPAEQGRVATTKVKNEENTEYVTKDGNDTEDKVFLLSLEEVLRYFDPDLGAKDPARRAKVTEYSKAQGGNVSSDSGYAGDGSWWLRSLSGNSDDAVAYDYGPVSLNGNYVNCSNRVVRPAFWLNLES